MSSQTIFITKGTTNVTVYVSLIQDNSGTNPGDPLTGLVYNSTGLVCYYVRPLSAAAALTLATQTVTGAHADGGFVEVDSTNMPGVYRLDLSDAIFATGVDSAVITLAGYADLATHTINVVLTSVNLYDSVRAGLTALPNAAAGAAGGLPTDSTGKTSFNDPSVNAIADQVWDENASAHTFSGTTGEQIKTILDNAATYASGAQANSSTLLTRLGVPTDFGSGTSTIAANLQDLADDGTNVYDRSTDSLQALRDRGDAAWTTGAGGSPPQLLQNTTIATLASQTSFTLTTGSADDNAYNGAIIIITDQATSTQKAVGEVSSYVGATKTITLSADPGIFTMAAGDTVDIIAALGAAGSGATAAEVWSYTTRVLTANTNLNDPTAAAIRAEIDSNSTQLAAIVTDTNELQTDWANGGRLDLIIDAILDDTGTNGVILTTAEKSVLVDLIWDEAISGHNTAGTTGKALKQIKEGVISAESTVNDVSATTTSFITALTETTDGHYDDLTLMFIDGALQGQARPILDYNGTTKTITLDEALTEAPVNGAGFIILALHIHPITQVVNGILDEALAGHSTAGTVGKALSDIDTNSSATQTLAAGASGFAAIKADTAAIVIDTNELQTDLTNGGRLDLILDAILDDTGASGVVLTAAERNAIADAILDRDMSTGTDSGSATVRTVRQALRANRNKVSISGGIMTVTKEDDTTASWTATVTTTAGDPISAIDPADA